MYCINQLPAKRLILTQMTQSSAQRTQRILKRNSGTGTYLQHFANFALYLASFAFMFKMVRAMFRPLRVYTPNKSRNLRNRTLLS